MNLKEKDKEHNKKHAKFYGNMFSLIGKVLILLEILVCHYVSSMIFRKIGKTRFYLRCA
jgi:hypothetical protein